MVAAVRQGVAQREVARRLGVALATVQRWVHRARAARLDRVNWDDRSPRPWRTRRTAPPTEDLVLALRQDLRVHSDLGEYGAGAIRQELLRQGVAPCPSLRTIGRILERRGALDGQRRVRRPPPPRGWYLPAVAAALVELDSFDVIEGLVIRRGPYLSVLTGIAVHGGVPAAWPALRITARDVLAALGEHWGAFGLPGYAQFDNDTRFEGPRQHPDSVGRVVRFCLGLGVVPVFAPPREMGFQAAIESFNGRWQAKVWSRFEHRSLEDVQLRSRRYLAAVRQRLAGRLEAAPPRQPWPMGWQLDLQCPPSGTIIFLRRTTDQGRVEILGHRFLVDRHWPHRLVRAEVQLDAQRICFHALRRRSPGDQPLLAEAPYELPARRFSE